MSYRVNEVFYSLQGEGSKAGSACVFVRFSGCNLTCSRDGEAGFDCDTEFVSGRAMEAEEVAAIARGCLVPEVEPAQVGVVFTGGEPALQLDAALLDAFVAAGFRDLRVETNGTVALGELRERLWVTCSPKSAEHTLKLEDADELRYVRRAGQSIPRPFISGRQQYISPACGPDGFDADDLAWCVALVEGNPTWRLSIQQHKILRLR